MLRLERRVDVPRWWTWAVPVASVLAAMVLGAVLIVSSGNDPLDVYRRIFESAVLGSGSLSGTVVAATPLLFTGLAAAAAFRMGVFNIGGEGQFIIGAIAGSGVALRFGESMGAGVIPLMIVAAAVAGALWAAIAGALRAWFKTNEIITSLMLNYIALNIGDYLIFNSESSWRLLEGSGRMFPQGKPIDTSAEWPFSHVEPVDFPFGFWLGVIIAIVVWVLYRRTRFGFEVKVIADSPSAATYAGMRARRTIVSVMALSGALAGIGGASDIGDTRHVFDPKGLRQSGYGYTGIVVAALARLNPVAVVPVALLMGGLNNAGRALQGRDFPAGLVGTLQGLILFCALGGEILARYRVRRVAKAVVAS